jgi:hypothetical protein
MKKMRFVLYPLALNERRQNFKVAKLYNAVDHDRHTSLSQPTNCYNEIAEPTVPGDIIRAEPELTLKRLKPRFGFYITAAKQTRATPWGVPSNPR